MESRLEEAILHDKEKALEEVKDLNMKLVYQSLLCIACTSKSNKCIKLLVDKGADINFSYNKNHSPLSEYLSKTFNQDSINLDIVKLLVDKGADVNFIAVMGSKRYDMLDLAWDLDNGASIAKYLNTKCNQREMYKRKNEQIEFVR